MTPILLLAEAYGESEARHSAPLVGPSGAELLRMLDESDIIHLSPAEHAALDTFYATRNSRPLLRIWDAHPEVHRTNVFNLHPPHNELGYFLGAKADGLAGYPALKLPKGRHARPAGNFVRAEFGPELARLGDELLEYNPNIIVCLGNCALWALTGNVGVGKLRGTTLLSTHTVAGFKLIPTYHPAAILRAWDNRPIAVADLIKAKRESAHATINRPHRQIHIEPTLAEIHSFISTHVAGSRLLSVDIETAGTRITCIGLAPNPNLALVIPFDDPRTANGCFWPTASAELSAWAAVRGVLEDPTIPKLFQNGAYDIAFLYRSMHVKVRGAMEDTMLLHHALHPETLKSLGFLGSIYSDEGSWKDMRKAKTTKRDD